MQAMNLTQLSSKHISGQTSISGIIGNPVGHTTTPPLFNTAYEKLGLDYVHIAFQVDNDKVGDAVKGIRALNIRGVLVTMPHKLAVIPFLDEIDPLAQKIGAVNAIVNTNGVLKGYNFDAPGFLQPLLETGFQPEDKDIVVLGAGGGARAVTFALADKGANLTILNRMQEFDWAVGLAGNLSHFSGKEVKALELSDDNLESSLARADLLVNTTSVGFDALAEETQVPERSLRADLPVYDIVFSPIKTRLLAEAEKKGAKTIPGFGMTVNGNAIFFQTITGVKAPIELMKATIIEVLKAREK